MLHRYKIKYFKGTNFCDIDFLVFAQGDFRAGTNFHVFHQL